jgi:hypothetical protein
MIEVSFPTVHFKELKLFSARYHRMDGQTS